MRSHQLFSSLLIRWFAGIVLVFSALSVMYAQSPTAPTASEEPAKNRSDLAEGQQQVRCRASRPPEGS